MKKTIVLLICAVMLMMLLCTCGKAEKPAEVPSAPVQTEDPLTAAKTPEEIEAALPALSPEVKQMLEETLECMKDIHPGTAGSSLRSASTLGHILDLGELAAPVEDRSAFAHACFVWYSENLTTDDERHAFDDSAYAVWEALQDYKADPSSFSGLMDDSGYVLQHDSYNYDNTEWAMDLMSIARATAE